MCVCVCVCVYVCVLCTGHVHSFEKILLRCAWSPDGSKVSCGSADRMVSAGAICTHTHAYTHTHTRMLVVHAFWS